MPKGQKHLIKCRCILPQYRKHSSPPFHHFVVFSELNDQDDVIAKFVQCNNCRTVHKVTGLCQSEIMHGKEHMRSVKTLDDIKLCLPPRLTAILDTNAADIASYEAAQYIMETAAWGDTVLLSVEEESDIKQGKYVRILSENLFKVDTFTSEIIVKGEDDD